MYKTYFSEILIPFVNQQRETYGRQGEWAVLWFDGEQIQLDATMDPQCKQMLQEAKIIMLKGPAATTSITQLLDVSEIFNVAHKVHHGSVTSMMVLRTTLSTVFSKLAKLFEVHAL